MVGILLTPYPLKLGETNAQAVGRTSCDLLYSVAETTGGSVAVSIIEVDLILILLILEAEEFAVEVRML